MSMSKTERDLNLRWLAALLAEELVGGEPACSPDDLYVPFQHDNTPGRQQLSEELRRGVTLDEWGDETGRFLNRTMIDDRLRTLLGLEEE